MSTPIDFTQFDESLSIRADASSVMACLTDESRLRQWFAPRVELEPHVGGKFVFQSPAFSFGEIVAKITEWESDRIGFVREILDRESQVLWTVTAGEEESRFAWRQVLWEGSNDYSYFLSRDQANVAMYNLRAYLETGKPALWPSPGEQGTVKMSITVQAPEGDVWASLTEPEVMDKYLSKKAEVDLRPGGRYSYGWRDEVREVGPSHVVEVEPGRRLVHDWYYTDEPQTQVEWLVEGGDGFTVVTLTHTGFGEYKNLPPYVGGWAAFMLALKNINEGRELIK